MNTAHKNWIRFVFTAVVSLSCLSASAQYAVNWCAIGGGGGQQSASGRYTLSGTVGQAATDLSAAGNFSVATGFWAGADTLVAPPPWLTIQRSGGNVIVSWPSWPDGFVLQSTMNLGRTPVWQPVAEKATLVGSDFQVTIPASRACQFFRLAAQQ